MNIDKLYMDRGFENIRRIMPGSSILNTNVADEHVPEIFIHIRVIKEHARAICITLQLNEVPERIVIENILFVVLWMNALPPIGGISQNYPLEPPCQIVF